MQKMIAVDPKAEIDKAHKAFMATEQFRRLPEDRRLEQYAEAETINDELTEENDELQNDAWIWCEHAEGLLMACKYLRDDLEGVIEKCFDIDAEDESNLRDILNRLEELTDQTENDQCKLPEVTRP